MPRDAIVVLDPNPDLAADCALSILGVIYLAIDMEKHAGADIRILAVPTAGHDDLLSDLVHLRDGSRNFGFIYLLHNAEYPRVPILQKRTEAQGIISYNKFAEAKGLQALTSPTYTA
ncbi:hypothetical protein FPOAC2_10613 [Fusarium poae]|uniref:hypothetical protein n=1 Tax=Fusarium poae TaxID=36050 RepID=UPI001CE95D42|nr:hypothetical protein FPOAC1_010336 [Fusarium poae]KAG8665539.1 hypothetical protein FPOAC1_010336 [Fusarium poae]